MVIGHGVEYEKQLIIVLYNEILNKGEVATPLHSKCLLHGDKEE